MSTISSCIEPNKRVVPTGKSAVIVSAVVERVAARAAGSLCGCAVGCAAFKASAVGVFPVGIGVLIAREMPLALLCSLTD